MQKELPIFQDVNREMKFAPMDLVKTCRHRLDAIRLCIQLSDMPQELVFDLLGINKGHGTRMLNGQAHFNDKKANELMKVCGNYAPLQFEAWSNNFELVAMKQDARIRELEEQLAAAKAG